MRVFYGKTQALVFAGLCAFATTATAVTQYDKGRKPFLFDITTITTSLNLPVSDKVEVIKMTSKQMTKRIERAPSDETIEPLSLILNDNETNIVQAAERLAVYGKVDELTKYFRKKLTTARPVKKGATSKTVEIDAAGLALIDYDAFANMYSKTHHNLTIDTKELRKDKAAKAELMKQLSPFLSKKERNKLLTKINKGEPIDINTEMLPEFPRKMVGKYIIQRGPNCFHASLAFNGPQMTASSLINVKTETGYHRAMINYDELWRVLNKNFYEVDPDQTPLKYGDVMVFFDVPEGVASDLNHPVDFKWIRHTTTYLFGGYTFSKGSKSPNTPYTVRTLADEWHTWKKYTQNLGVKVFRRSTKKVRATPPRDLADWVY